MKFNKSLVRALAVLMVAAMCFGLVGCVSSYNSNPMVAKVGNVKLDLNQYLTLYNNTDTSSNIYYAYLQYGIIDREQYANYILDELVNYGVQLDQVDVQNITLDAEEEAKLQQDVEDQIKEYVKTNYLSSIDKDAVGTDEDAQYSAALEIFKAELKKNGSNYDKYRASVEESLRKSARLNKLRDITIKDVAVTNDDVKTYYSDNVKTDVTVSSFKTAWDNFIEMKSEAAPLFIPHPERAVEDDPETTDKDETKEADPFAEIFSVMHVLLQFSKEADTSVTNLKEYGESDEEFTKKIEDFEKTIETLSSEEFLAKCADKDICEDPGMQEPSYQYFGYMMQSSLLSSYYDGFGYAAMKLKYGEEWKSDGDKENDKQAESIDKPSVPEYELTYFTLTDGAKVAKVLTKAGAHYLILNTNDCYNLYDEDGYLMLPLYNGDELVMDGENIATAHGTTMTQAQLDAMNETLSHIKTADAETTEESGETSEDTEETEDKTVTAKTVYEYYRETKLTAMQNEFYNDAFKQWKENTKIVTKNKQRGVP